MSFISPTMVRQPRESPDQMVRFLLGEISTTVLGVLTTQDPTKILD